MGKGTHETLRLLGKNSSVRDRLPPRKLLAKEAETSKTIQATAPTFGDKPELDRENSTA